MEPIPGVFDTFQYFKTILPILALLEACDDTEHGRHLDFIKN